jgi:hypothetical protein
MTHGLRWGLAVLLVFSCLNVQAGPVSLEGPLANRRGGPVQNWLAAQRGKAFGIYVWSDQCKACLRMTGGIRALGEDWPVLGIATQSGGRARVQRYLATHKLDIPTLSDPDGRLAALFGLQDAPGFIVVDAKGEVATVKQGYVTEAGMRFRLFRASRQ